MKRKYLYFILILILVIVVEIIVFSLMSAKRNKQNEISEVVNLDDITFSDLEEVDTETLKESIKIELQQAKLQREQHEKELKEKWSEILKRRAKLLKKEQIDNQSSITDTSNNDIINIGQNNSDNTSNITNNNENNNTNPGGENKEKNPVVEVSKVLENGEKNYTSKIEDLGIPLITKYPRNIKAHISSRNVWDMQLYNNRIYIGSGDYGSDTGPAEIYYYDIEKGEFINEGSIPDEQINRYFIIDNELIITGTDPREGWDYGNYFIWKDNSWIKMRTILGGIHNFDLVKFHGKLFVGIGNDSDSSIVMSEDGGQTFSYVYMYESRDKLLEIRDGFLSVTYRVYDFIEYNDKLYALSNRQVYEYIEEENIFLKLNDNYIDYGEGTGLGSYVPLKTKLTYNGKIVLINGAIQYTNSLEKLENYNMVQFNKTTYAYDAKVINGELHVLCATPEDNGYYISVYKTTNYQEWENVMYFKYSDFARSFEYSDGTYYFGIGTPLEDNDDGTNAGRILRVKM